MLELRDVAKRHHLGDVSVHALEGVTLTIARGELVALYGPSGSGKTTLIKLIVGLDGEPDSGSILIDGRELATMTPREADDYRLHTLGVVGDPRVLQPGATAVRAAAIRVAMYDPRNAERRVVPLLAELGLGGRLKHKVEQLSMGERQRVALALALSTSPQLVLADEPTAHLDRENTHVVLALLAELCRERGVALLLATHDLEAAKFAGRIVELRDGRLEPYQREPQVLAEPAERR